MCYLTDRDVSRKETDCMELSVVIPAFNEENDIQTCIRTIITYLEKEHISFEIRAVDDGSTDRTLERIRHVSASDPRIRPLTNGKNRGKGFTVRHGVLESLG